MRKKIAICLYGLPETEGKYGKGNVKNIERNYQSFKNNILDFNNSMEMDVYIHTWAFRHEKLLRDLYKPIKMRVDKNKLEISSKQVGKMIYGWKWYIELSKSLLISIINGGGVRSSLILGRVHSILSRWKSVNTVLNLCGNERYDACILARLDLYYIRPIDLSEMDFDKMHIPVMNSYFHDRKLKSYIDTHDVGISLNKISDIFQISSMSDAYKQIELYEKIKNGVESLSPHVAVFNLYKKNIMSGMVSFDIYPGYNICIGRDFNGGI